MARGVRNGHLVYPTADPTEIARRVSVRVGQARRAVSSYLPFLPFIVLSIGASVVLARVFLLRLGHPLDLEWMEGGVLTHALRLERGQPLYAQPSVDFVSFLCTAPYAAVLSVLSRIFGLSCVLGRAAGAGDLRALPPLLRRPGRRKRASPHHGGERRLFLAPHDHLRP
jgi:hypothetical protein